MTKEAKKAAKQEKKLKILLGGYMVSRQKDGERGGRENRVVVNGVEDVSCTSFWFLLNRLVPKLSPNSWWILMTKWNRPVWS